MSGARLYTLLSKLGSKGINTLDSFTASDHFTRTILVSCPYEPTPHISQPTEEQPYERFLEEEKLLEGEDLESAHDSISAFSSSRGNQDDIFGTEEVRLKAIRVSTLAYKAEAVELQKQLRHLQSQFDVLTAHGSTLVQGRRARVSATSTVNGHLTTLDDSLSARNLQMNAVLERISSTAQDLALYHSGEAYSNFHPFLLGDPSCIKELNQWFAKQFDTGPCQVVAEEGKSECSRASLDDASNILVRDVENSRHQRVSELQWLLASDEAHIHLDLHSLKKKHVELVRELSNLYLTEKKLFSETIPALCWELAQLQDTYILQGDYDLKVMRQEFYISRQKAFIAHLINHLARHQFLNIACQLEKKNLFGAYSLLKVIESELQGYLSATRAAAGKQEQGAVDDQDTFLHGVRDLLNTQAGLSTYVSAPRIVQQISSLHSDLMTLQSDLKNSLPQDIKCINELLQQLLFPSSTTAQLILAPCALMKELDGIEKINAKLSAAVEEATLEHCKKSEVFNVGFLSTSFAVPNV
ncbi:AUGMIN subunit 3 [Citrus sinensis]|uniref:AUGMIN subunit 3 n=1 Tax=Citrus sinensis TaxID=2711 RepID=A0ACB8N8H6_CITSI|nr:AUGMIN subunit 3 [Citrus sinensis]